MDKEVKKKKNNSKNICRVESAIRSIKLSSRWPKHCCHITVVFSRLFLQTQNRSSDNKRIVVMYCSSLFVIVSFFWNNNTVDTLLSVNTDSPGDKYYRPFYATLLHTVCSYTSCSSEQTVSSLKENKVWEKFTMNYLHCLLVGSHCFACEKWEDNSFDLSGSSCFKTTHKNHHQVQ